MNIIESFIASLWIYPWYRQWRKQKYAEKNTKRCKFNGSVLTRAQKAQIDTYWKPYPKFKKLFHAFYTDATGKFFVNYIPDSLWYGIIDCFYNPDVKANEMDDKSLYERLFPSSIIRHPKTILSKVNGYWINPVNMKLTPPTRLSICY